MHFYLKSSRGYNEHLRLQTLKCENINWPASSIHNTKFSRKDFLMGGEMRNREKSSQQQHYSE